MGSKLVYLILLYDYNKILTHISAFNLSLIHRFCLILKIMIKYYFFEASCCLFFLHFLYLHFHYAIMIFFLLKCLGSGNYASILLILLTNHWLCVLSCPGLNFYRLNIYNQNKVLCICLQCGLQLTYWTGTIDINLSRVL